MTPVLTMNPQRHDVFSWDTLGNIKEGRKHLGETMPVLVYRMLAYSMNAVLCKNFGQEQADELFRQAGFKAGSEFAVHVLPLDADENTFISTLIQTIEQLKIGILRMEETDFKKGEVVITVHEDLDCSGLPVSNELVCKYDEGFLAGILHSYTKQNYTVREVECWANGNRVCRFKGCVTDESE